MFNDYDLNQLYVYSGSGLMRAPKPEEEIIRKTLFSFFTRSSYHYHTDFSKYPYSVEEIHRKRKLHIAMQLWLFREVDGEL